MGGDLHCHTKLSDGSLGIEDLVLLAKKKGIETIAITDHDCLAGTVRGKIIGDRYGVNVIPGVELSSRDEKTGKCGSGEKSHWSWDCGYSAPGDRNPDHERFLRGSPLQSETGDLTE